MQYHRPVLLQKSLEYLNIRKNCIYVDATLGGGGHTKAILEKEPSAKVFAFDRDMDAIAYTKKLQEDFRDRLMITKSNFTDIRTHLALNRIKKVDGILFDLGVSSHQIDQKQRGFSFSYDAPLDMRMDRSAKLTAYEIINKYSLAQLNQIFFEYGEEREAARIAKAIVNAREERTINTTGELADIIEKAIRSHRTIKAKARIFQAIRIYINGELEALKSAMQDAVKMLNPEGRLVVISYHSLEDRIVKRFLKYEEKDCICSPSLPKCICDKTSTIEILTRKPVVPGNMEITENPRARSAKLRAARKKEIS